jgi:hypothetical protein
VTRLQQSASIAIVLLICALAVEQWLTIVALDDGLSATADSWTEADTVRAAASYAENGFAANAGLPDLCYGDQFPEQGTKKLLRINSAIHERWTAGTLAGRKDAPNSERFIYTHYPPGPHLLAGFMTRLFGPDNISLYRILPVSIMLCALSFLAWEMSRQHGAVAAASLLLALVLVPMTRNMMHGLSYQGYALALLVLELGLCLRLFRMQRFAAASMLAFAAVGFAQGCLGFDYVFLVALAPLVVGLIEPRDELTWRRLAIACVVAAAGFTVAHVLHGLQVAVYLGSMDAAFEDFSAVAQYRSYSSQLDSGLRTQGVRSILWLYLTEFTALPLHIGASALLTLVCGSVSLFMLRTVSPISVSRSQLYAIAAAVALSSCWVLLMPQHSAQHWHFIPTHYFLVVFVTALVMTAAFKRLPELHREQFVWVWLATAPLGILAASVLRTSFGGAVSVSLQEPAAPESLLAFACTVLFLLLHSKRQDGISARAMISAPLAYAVGAGILRYVRDAIWPREFGELELASPVVLAFTLAIAAYGFTAAGVWTWKGLYRPISLHRPQVAD